MTSSSWECPVTSQHPFLNSYRHNALKLLTLARDLQRRKARERQRLFAVEGVRAVEELIASPARIRGVLVSPALATTSRGAALEAAIRNAGTELLPVSEDDLASAAETDSPQGVLAVAEVPDTGFADLPATPMRLVILDGVQDPGNVGTIIRTAAAFGAAGVVAMPGTVDLWNAKVVRGTMGASFRVPVWAAEWGDLDAYRASTDLAVWGADASGQPIDSVAAPARLALVVGNEGAGLSAEARQRTTALVALPLAPIVESLNVAVATGILLYQLRQ